MPGYIEGALAKYHTRITTKQQQQHAPHIYIYPNYGAQTQLSSLLEKYEPLSPAEKTKVQETIGTLLYYSRAVDSIILVTL